MIVPESRLESRLESRVGSRLESRTESNLEFTARVDLEQECRNLSINVDKIEEALDEG